MWSSKVCGNVQCPRKKSNLHNKGKSGLKFYILELSRLKQSFHEYLEYTSSGYG